jgi:hypothetical protein
MSLLPSETVRAKTGAPTLMAVGNLRYFLCCLNCGVSIDPRGAVAFNGSVFHPADDK